MDKFLEIKLNNRTQKIPLFSNYLVDIIISYLNLASAEIPDFHGRNPNIDRGPIGDLGARGCNGPPTMMFPCSCGEMITYGEQIHHDEFDCPQKRRICFYCQIICENKEELIEHKNLSCMRSQTKCKFCDTSMILGNLELHYPYCQKLFFCTVCRQYYSINIKILHTYYHQNMHLTLSHNIKGTSTINNSP